MDFKYDGDGKSETAHTHVPITSTATAHLFSVGGLREHTCKNYAEDVCVLELVSGLRELESPLKRLLGA